VRPILVIGVLVLGSASAQSVRDGVGLLRKVEARAKKASNFRAEVVEKSQSAALGTDVSEEVHIAFSSQVPLKMRRENSGDDRTLLVCDGTESFYSGDGLSYYRNPATLHSDCSLPLVSLFRLSDDAVSVSVISKDHVVLAQGDRACTVVRAEWRPPTGATVVRTMCIDPEWDLILRDVTVTETAKMRISVTSTFLSYESNPKFSSNTFHFVPSANMREAKAP